MTSNNRFIDQNGRAIETDKDGYLKHLEDWNEDIALCLANQEAIILVDEHWEIIFLLKQFYQEFDISPAMRPLVKYVARTLGKEKGNSIYLMTLFPPSPAKVASKIAGLPKPTNCI